MRRLLPAMVMSLALWSAAARGQSAAAPPVAQPAKLTPKNGPMEITATKEASYEDRARKATFVGDVHVKNADFTLSAEKLTVFFKKGAEKAKPAGATDAGKGSVAGEFGGGGMDKVVAEGKVVITHMTANANGGEPTRYLGTAERVEYDADSGNVRLSGWPKVQQGINSHCATDESTVMILNRDGTMKTIGQSKTLIEDTGQAKKL